MRETGHPRVDLDLGRGWAASISGALMAVDRENAPLGDFHFLMCNRRGVILLRALLILGRRCPISLRGNRPVSRRAASAQSR